MESALSTLLMLKSIIDFIALVELIALSERTRSKTEVLTFSYYPDIFCIMSKTLFHLLNSVFIIQQEKILQFDNV